MQSSRSLQVGSAFSTGELISDCWTSLLGEEVRSPSGKKAEWESPQWHEPELEWFICCLGG